MVMESVTLSSRIQTAASNTETESKKLQSQILAKEQHLNRLSSDSQKTQREKEKESQEIKQQIEELNRRLETLRLEEEEEKAEQAELSEKKVNTKEEEKKELLESEEKNKDEKEHLKVTVEDVAASVSNTHKILSGDSLWQQERLQMSIDRRKEQRETTLEAEIETDKMHGNDTKKKEKELKELRSQVDVTRELPKGGIRKTFIGSDNSSEIIIIE